jgi:hypothetical protein
MPEDKSTGVTIDEYEKDKTEFADSVDILLAADDDQSDEELKKELEKKLGPEDGTAGEATKDHSGEGEKSGPAEDDDLFTDDQGVAQTDNSADTDNTTDTDSDGTIDWQSRAEEAEAELKKERQKTSSWDGRIKAANQKAKDLAAENEQLKQQLAQQPDPDAESDKEVLDRFRSDFPELAEVVDVLDKRISGQKQAPAKVPDDVLDSDDEGSSGDSTATDESATGKSHMETVNEAHPDLPEMVNSGVLLTWIQKQKPFMRPHLEDIYYKGNAKSVIDLCSQFKESTGWKSQLTNQNSDKAKTKQQKLDAMKEVSSESGGAPTDGPDMQNFDQGASDAGLV